MNNKPKIILLADDDNEDQEVLEEVFLSLEPAAKMVMFSDGKELNQFPIPHNWSCFAVDKNLQKFFLQ